MDKIHHIWLHGPWQGAWHTTVHFVVPERSPALVYACSCGIEHGPIPNLRDVDDADES